MRIRRARFAVLVVALLAAVLLASGADVPAAALTTRVTIPIVGTVNGLPESVALSGKIEIANTLVTDPLLTTPKERLVLKLVGVSGAGLVTGAKYVATGEDTLLRRLVASDHIAVMFPFYRATADGPRSARSAAASVTLDFDLLTGAVTKATASFSTPTLPAAED